MRYLRIFLLYFQNVSEQRARSFVWFLLSLFGPLVLILFWRGAKITGNITFSEITTYYLLLIIAGSLLMAHIEEEVARLDIQQGSLVGYILKPFSYFWLKFFIETPWRIIQGFFGVITLLLCIFFLNVHFSITHSLFFIIAGITSSVFAYMLSFTYKMTRALITFWLTDISGVFQFFEMLEFIFAGFIVPIYLFPHVLQQIAYLTPFVYIIYFPIAVFQQKFSIPQTLLFLFIQLCWIVFFHYLYRFLWRKGVLKFTGVGQ